MDSFSVPKFQDSESEAVRCGGRWSAWEGGCEGWWRGGWRVAGVLAVAIGWAHGRALQAAFFMDDEVHILHRETGKIANGMHYGFRWVTGLIWDAIYAVFGASSVAFHALNLALHFAVAFGLWGVGRRLMERVAPLSRDGLAGVAALAGALVFATHPLMTEGVNYAQNASLQLVTLFVVASVGCSLRYFETAKAGWVAAVAACVALGAFTKEVGVIFVVLSAGLVWLLIGGQDAWRMMRTNAPRMRWALYALVPALVYFVVYAGRLAVNTVQAPMWAENFFTQGRLFWSYVRLMVWPAGLCSDHLVPFSGVGLADPWSLGATGAVGLLVVVLGVGLWKGKGRLVCLLVALGLIPLLLRLGYANKELFVEYRAYPAFPWIALAVGWLVAPWLRRWRLAGAAVGLLVIGTFSVVSSERSGTWSDAGRLAEDAIRRYPNHIRARTHLQKIALNAGDFDRVLALRDETLKAFENLRAHNKSPDQPRKYEATMPYRGYLCAEHFVAIALTEREGSQSGLRHAARIIEEHRGLHPEFFDPNNMYYEIVEQIVDIYSVLVEHGAAYDQRREAAKAALEKNDPSGASRQAATR